MAGPSWLVDPNRIATKIRSASGRCDPLKVSWSSNPTKSCPNCQFTIDNSDVAHEWPGLPSGVKFDPSDQEIMWHLLAKVGLNSLKPHPFIDEFIPTVEEDDGICYTHPQNLPGVKQDGRVSHFFHRAIKAYNTGTRKRRKIHGDDLGDVRWHKTGRTKPVFLDGIQKGCKKIMVLYISPVRGGKAEKTNWVMHQYHLGTGEDEREGEYVISKVFYQQQQGKQSEKIEEDISEGNDAMITKVDPVTPKSVTPEPPCTERRLSSREPELYGVHMLEEVETPEPSSDQVHNNMEIQTDQVGNEDDEAAAEDKWWENESQFLLSSQQLVEGLSLCDELLQSQSPNRDDNADVQAPNDKPRLSDYARLGPEHLKRDLEACIALVPDPANVELDTPPDFRLSQTLVPASANIELDTPPDFRLSQALVPDPANIELDTPPDFRLSQLEFESQDSYIAWGGSLRGGRTID
ncbi:SUPPRESSOR OF GAMMA RESPONSE 1 [Henckelia pumila]|uniref:SUPPRESSOR OF GAMMA RESPONSE 1 n=1 Tax=Henckelia pumila TaxID=405737 RepID=UPI003C6DE8E2